MFWDWLSLFQKDHNNNRTVDEQAAFGRALANMGMWYAHKKVMCFYLTQSVDPEIKYERRGWTFFERSCAELIKNNKAMNDRSWKWSMCIDIGGSGESDARQVPIAPACFADELSQKQFTTKADKASVVKLYTKTSLAMLRGLKEMDLSNCVPSCSLFTRHVPFWFSHWWGSASIGFEN